MPQMLAVTVAMLGAAALLRWCIKEVRRVNFELDTVRAAAKVEPFDREALPTLKRDPVTGEYRPS